ncbi:MAG: hypothetical protein PHU04_04450 [Candidatus Peribacteraceae bacterium]|nr:hypothetical protein [Candidatus Peribacteraceae bacterium]
MKTFLHWAARILLVLLIGFFLLMGLDVFEMPGTLAEQLVGYLIHSIPAIILILLLVLAHRNVTRAGIACIVLAVAGLFFFHAYNNIVVFLLVTGLPLLIGGVFLYEGKRKC